MFNKSKLSLDNSIDFFIVSELKKSCPFKLLYVKLWVGTFSPKIFNDVFSNILFMLSYQFNQ